MSRKRVEYPTHEILYKLLAYEFDTGILRWKPRDNVKHTWNTRYANKIVGTMDGHGYSQVRINRRHFQAHRLIWKLVYGSDPKDEIDHINGDKNDNRITNLREATRQQQLYNSKRRLGKKLPKGVTLCNRKYIHARITIDGRMIYLGTFKTIEAAAFAYQIAAIKHFGEFARAE